MESQFPVLADPAMSLSLDGAWRLRRWPFAVPESKLSAAAADDRDWAVVPHPGKVFYADPDAEGAPIPNVIQGQAAGNAMPVGPDAVLS